MLRKFALSLRNPVKHNPLILQTLFKPAINAYFANQNFNRSQNQSVQRKSPFGGFKKEQNPTKTENTHAKSDQKFSIDIIFKMRISPVKDAFAAPQFLETYNPEFVHQRLEEVWHSYLGIKKLIIQVQTARKNMQDVKRLINPNIYLSNEVFTNQDVLYDLDDIVNQLHKLYEKYEAETIAHPNAYVRVLKILVLFEKCHQNKLFWDQANQILSKILAENKNRELDIEDVKLMTTFLKVLSKRSYYLFKTKTTSAQVQQNVKKLKKEIFDCLIANTEKVNLSFWIGLMDQLDYTNDELLPNISAHVGQLLRNPLDRTEVVKCWNRVIKKKSRSHFANFVTQLKSFLIESARNNELKTSDIMVIFFALSKEASDNLNRQDFDILWNNLYDNIVVQKDRDFTLFTISSIFSNVFTSDYINQERYNLLQEWCLIGLENSNTQTKSEGGEVDEVQQEEEEIEVNQDTEPKNVFHSSCTLILNLLGQGKELQGVNIELIRGILSKLRKHIDDLNPGIHSLLLFSCAKILLKYSEKSRRLDKQSLDDLSQISREFASIIGPKFLENIRSASSPDIARIFYTYGAVGYMDQKNYEIFESTIMKDLSRMASFFCKYILQGIAFLKKNPGTSGINTEILEKAMISKIISSLENAEKDEVFNTIQSTQLLYPLQESLAVLAPKLEEKFYQFMEDMTFIQISFTLSVLRNYLNLKTETFEKAATLLPKNFASSKLKNLYYVLKTYVNANSGSVSFFRQIENEVLKRIKNMSEEGAKVPKSDLYLYMLFFNDFVKFNVQNQELIPAFEKLFQDHIKDMRLEDVVLVINGMGTYLSKNHSLLKELLSICNEMLKIEDNRKFFLKGEPSLVGQAFQHGIFTMELEYKDIIDLRKYKELYELHKELSENVSAHRFRGVTTSVFQNNVADELKSMKYKIIEEHPIGIYIVDILIEPNIILEINGNQHYILGTKVMVWRKAKKIRQLKKLGYKVEIIPEYEWNIEISELKQPYLKNKIGF